MTSSQGLPHKSVCPNNKSNYENYSQQMNQLTWPAYSCSPLPHHNPNPLLQWPYAPVASLHIKMTSSQGLPHKNQS